MSEELDWGPARPPALSWAGGLLVLLALVQLLIVAPAVILDLDAFVERDVDLWVTVGVVGLLALQVIGGIGVLRLWRGWRAIAGLLALLGSGLHGANLAGAPDPPAVVAFNAAAAGLYLIVLTLLVRSRLPAR